MTSDHTREESQECPLCSMSDWEVVFRMSGVPVHCNVLRNTRDEALSCTRGDIDLAFCSSCGFIFNAAFDAKLLTYNEKYENPLHFSPRFQDYARKLAKDLVTRHGLRGKIIIEIGCGQADFLKLLCELGAGSGVGFDPGFVQGAAQEGDAAAGRVKVIKDFYSKRYVDYPCDLLCSRHVLEHIANPRRFLREIREAIGEKRRPVVFFEVPNADYILDKGFLWDIIYEHCSYFGPKTLALAFELSGFSVESISEEYEGQFLCVEARPGKQKSFRDRSRIEDLDSLESYSKTVSESFGEQIRVWNERLLELKEAGKKVVVWGAGSKGVTFLNMVATQDYVQYVVDINPRKKGKFISGTGQEIVGPDFLEEYGPDVILVMNPVYAAEIEAMVRSSLPEVRIVCLGG